MQTRILRGSVIYTLFKFYLNKERNFRRRMSVLKTQLMKRRFRHQFSSFWFLNNVDEKPKKKKKSLVSGPWKSSSDSLSEAVGQPVKILSKFLVVIVNKHGKFERHYKVSLRSSDTEAFRSIFTTVIVNTLFNCKFAIFKFNVIFYNVKSS